MKLTLTVFVTLDGVMQAPGGRDEDRAGGFDQGGWQFPYMDQDMGNHIAETIEAADAILLGRRTYEIWAAAWPSVPDEVPVAARLNGLPKYVVSTTLDKAEWNNSTIIATDVVAEIARLKEQPGGEIQVHGSGGLARTLIEHDLIDEYRIWTHPVVLGNGARFFDGVAPTALRLTDTKTTGAGIVICEYERAGKPTYGSFD